MHPPIRFSCLFNAIKTLSSLVCVEHSGVKAVSTAAVAVASLHLPVLGLCHSPS